MESLITQRLLRLPPTLRTIQYLSTRRINRFSTYPITPYSHCRHIFIPRIVTTSFWAAQIPPALKSRLSRGPSDKKPWNPATPYIILALLVGNQAIQTLWLKQERDRDLRRAEARIGILREVIGRIKNGEEVDVAAALGTGDPQAEAEWREVIKDIEEEEVLFQSRKDRKAAREATAQGAFNDEVTAKDPEKSPLAEPKVKVEAIGNSKFF